MSSIVINSSIRVHVRLRECVCVYMFVCMFFICLIMCLFYVFVSVTARHVSIKTVGYPVCCLFRFRLGVQGTAVRDNALLHTHHKNHPVRVRT